MEVNSQVGKVAILLGSFAGGGSERAMVNFANGLVLSGVKVDCLVGRNEGPFSSLVSPQIGVVPLAGGMLRSIPRIRKYVGKNRPQFLFASQSHVNCAAILSTRFLSNRPIVVLREPSTPSIALALEKSWRQRLVTCLLMAPLIRQADHLIATSSAAAIDCAEFYRLPKRKISYVYSPFVSQGLFELSQEAVDHPWLNERHRVVISVGRVMPVKDFETLIRAFARVRAYTPCKLIIVGDTDRDIAYTTYLKSLTSQLQISEEVDFVGFRVNPFPYLARSETYVTSSLYEGLPGALVQAMALGCKLVSTDCQSGPREVLGNGKYGWLVEVGNIGSMANAILRSFEVSINREVGLERSIDFTEERSIRNLTRLFSTLLAKKKYGMRSA